MKRSRVFVLGGLAGLVLLGIVLSRQTPQAPASSAETVNVGDSRTFIAAGVLTNDFPVEAPSNRLASLARSDLPGAVALLRAVPEGDQQRDMARQLLNDLFEENPRLAAEFVAQLPGPLDSQMASALASWWGRQDSAAAVSWAANLPRGPVRSQAMVSLCADWADATPQMAAAFVLNSDDSDFPLGSQNNSISSPADPRSTQLRSQMLEIIGARWAARDAEAAAAWAVRLPPGNSRDSFAAGLSSVQAETSPAEAAGLVASMTPGPRQEEAALAVLLQWGRADLPAAAYWLAHFPSGDLRDRALLNLAANSTEQEPEFASAFLLNWPEADERASAIRHFLTATLAENAARGVDLLAGIQDESLFQEETQRLAQHWLMQDPSAADQWIARTDLDPSAKTRLLSHPSLR